METKSNKEKGVKKIMFTIKKGPLRYNPEIGWADEGRKQVLTYIADLVDEKEDEVGELFLQLFIPVDIKVTVDNIRSFGMSVLKVPEGDENPPIKRRQKKKRPRPVNRFIAE